MSRTEHAERGRGWSEAFRLRALEYWTPERVGELTQGKTLAITPHEAPLVLRALGILHRDATMPPKERRKFFQINHMIAMIGPSLRELSARGRMPIRIVDAACGRSYLTVALAWALRHRHGCDVQVLGIDRSEALVEASRERARIASLEDCVRFVPSELAGADVRQAFRGVFGGPLESLDVLVSLHACDTATDDALVLGVELGTELFAVAPCCQAELAARWAASLDPAGPLSPLQASPHLRRELGALLTDTMRMLLLRDAGYTAWALEFVPTEHSAKNRLLRAKRGVRDPGARDEYARLAATCGSGIHLAERLAFSAGGPRGD